MRIENRIRNRQARLIKAMFVLIRFKRANPNRFPMLVSNRIQTVRVRAMECQNMLNDLQEQTNV